MTFQLYIMRHGKSDWSGVGTKDFDRPINKRGERSAIRVGQWMQDNDYIPEKIISSPAVRAKQTIELVVKQLDRLSSEQLVYDKELYLADLDALIETIQLYKNGVNSLMLVAHNPGLEALVDFLSSKPGSEYRSVTTANLAIFEYPDNQFDAFVDKGKLIEFIKPKELN